MPKGKYLDTANAGKSWNPDNDDEILDLWLAKEPLKPLADKLGRTVKALERRIWALATCYRGLMYDPLNRKSRSGDPNTERDQTVLNWVMRYSGMERGVKVRYAAQLLSRTVDEIKEMTGRQGPADDKGFGLL